MGINVIVAVLSLAILVLIVPTFKYMCAKVAEQRLIVSAKLDDVILDALTLGMLNSKAECSDNGAVEREAVKIARCVLKLHGVDLDKVISSAALCAFVTRVRSAIEAKEKENDYESWDKNK